jgi:glycosyltransferase involved in cell wall biosynthesis
VTVVTPSYNQGAFLEETIRSVLAQDYPDVEYIVFDGGSTDGSVEIIRRYADRLAWWTSEPGVNQPASLNRSFGRATGEVLGWLNSDDTLLPGSITTVVDALESDPEALLLYGDAVFTDETSRMLGPLQAREFHPHEMIRRFENYVVQPGSLFRRRALELAGPLNERAYYHFDLEFVLRLGAVGKVRRLDSTLATYRLHPGSKSIGAPLPKAVDFARVGDEFFAGPDLPESLRPLARVGRASAYSAAGEYFYAGGDSGRARRYLARGLALHPGGVSARSLSLLARSLLPAAVVRQLRGRRAERP